MKPKHQRLLLIVVSLACFVAATLLVLKSFRDNLVYFYSPSDIARREKLPEGTIRIGGLVQLGTVQKMPDNELGFVITDGARDIRVHYRGTPPNLFREGQGVIAEGYMTEPGRMTATSLLAKHDENYMPKEVVDSLKKTGHWKEQYGK